MADWVKIIANLDRNRIFDQSKTPKELINQEIQLWFKKVFILFAKLKQNRKEKGLKAAFKRWLQSSSWILEIRKLSEELFQITRSIETGISIEMGNNVAGIFELLQNETGIRETLDGNLATITKKMLVSGG